jgi:Zn-dependent peptidase ImmA (M78 family)
MTSIGERALGRLERLNPPLLHRDIAERIGMTPDAFSRALNGKRHFASIELARLAELIGVDLHWLITGLPDPHQLSVAARHDADSGDDEQVLADITLAYRQAYSAPGRVPQWPGSPARTRDALGSGFVRTFADRVENRLGVGIVRLAELSIAYSLTIAGRTVIALPATGNWVRDNWNIAHELGHLIEGHRETGGDGAAQEQAADAFAAELLLPAAEMQWTDWGAVRDDQLAGLVWSWGVSIEILGWRLNTVLGYPPERVAQWAALPTQRLLRQYLPVSEITARMDAAARRRFPLSLQEAHLELIASGAISPDTLAWMLGVPAATLPVDAPDMAEVNIDDLSTALGL